MKLAPQNLRSIVDRVERIEEEIKERNNDKRDIYAEAKGQGFDIPALKAVIARRRKDPEKVEEFDAMVDVYLTALAGGTVPATRAPAQEPPPVKPIAKLSGRPIPDAGRNESDDLGIPDFLQRQPAHAET